MYVCALGDMSMVYITFFWCDRKAYVDLIVGRAVLFLQFLAVNVDSDALSRVDLQSNELSFFFNGNMGGSTHTSAERDILWLDGLRV